MPIINLRMSGEKWNEIKVVFCKVKRRILGGCPSVKELRECGVMIGDNCDIYGSIDNGHDFLVSMGNNVTLAGGSRILTHDGSTKKIVGYSRVGRVDIGDDVFIGAGAVVTKDILNNSLVAGNPAKIIGTYDAYVDKTKKRMEMLPVWNTHYSNKKQEEKQQIKATLLDSGYGFDI